MELINIYKSAFNFAPTGVFRWSPEDKLVHFNKEEIATERGKLSLLHEIAHAKLKHKSFSYDLDLVCYEVEAWQETKQLAKSHGLEIDEDHIESCLDTYRTWLHNRSICPNCSQSCLESDPQVYSCFNCQQKWSVSKDQTCQIKRQRLS